MQVFYIKNTAAETRIDQLLPLKISDVQESSQNIKPNWELPELLYQFVQ